MKLVTHTLALTEKLTMEQALTVIAQAGFDGVDCSFMDMSGENSIWLQEDWCQHAKELKKLAEELGISFCQAHAPFPPVKHQEPYDTVMRRRVLRAMEAAAILGAEHIVVHLVHYFGYSGTREEQYRESVAFYRGLIPCCEEFGIRVCAENMWRRDPAGVIREAVLARPEEFSRLLDEIDSPWVCGCLDIGHIALVGQDPGDMIRRMGKAHIQCLHVHDVDYVSDCHTMPFLQKLDWHAITDALKDIGYTGNFTFEAENYLKPMPVELWPDALKLLERVGRYLTAKIEQ